jgi:NADPH:quinone reductase-like Zn-dependent oxidoreductase
MAAAAFQMPTSQFAVELDACSDPLSSIRVNHAAELPAFPESGINTIVRVLHASINPIDYKLPSMPYPIPRMVYGSSPIIPGTSFVGKVWKTTHPDLKTGDIVWGKHDTPMRFGACASYTLISGDQGIVKIPDGWPADRGLDEFAGAGVVALTALQTLRAGDLPYNTSGGKATGGNVFINGGSGGVGSFTVQMAKHCFGCEKVVVSCSAANVEFVKTLGADEVVDYRNCGIENVSGWLNDWSSRSSEMFDIIIDNVGSESDIYWQCHRYLKANKGQYVQVGGRVDFGSLTALAKKMLWPSFLGGGKRMFQFLRVENKREDFELYVQAPTPSQVMGAEVHRT